MDLAVGRLIVPAHTGRGYRAESRTFDRRVPRSRTPRAAYEIDDRAREEIIAGGYERTDFFDEVVLTRCRGDLGRDVMATKKMDNTFRSGFPR